MKNELIPRIEQWYAHRDKGEMFRVVAVDAASGAVEIQNFDGDVAEIERDAWRDMDIEAAEAPEDWTGPYDDVESDDLGDTGTAPKDWRASLESLPSGEEGWDEQRAAEEESKPGESERIAQAVIEEEQRQARRRLD